MNSLKTLIQFIFLIPALLILIILIFVNKKVRNETIEVLKMKQTDVEKTIKHFLPFAYSFSILIYLIIYIYI